MANSDLTDIDVQVHAETAKAWRVSTDGDHDTAVWVPKSQCELELSARSNTMGTLTCPEWLAIEKGLA